MVPRPSTFSRVALLIIAALAVTALIVITGSYIWLSVVLSKANRQPGVEEARLVLQESHRLQTSKPTGTPPATEDSVPSTSAAPLTLDVPGTTNLLLLGIDKRPGSSEPYGRSDTMILVHIDPQSGLLSMLSLMRDTRVEIPGFGFQKLNAAYALGGPSLAIRTIEDLTGVPIHHFAAVDLEAFRALVDHFGGIYLDVDRRYFDKGEELIAIDLQPGYQRLNGDQALRYVRTRHDQGHDWARIARQQHFLRAVKEQVFSWNLAYRLPGAVATLSNYLATDMGAAELLKLVWWASRLDMGSVRQVTLPGKDVTIDGIAYAISAPDDINKAVKAFLAPPTQSSTTTVIAPNAVEVPPREEHLDLSNIDVQIRDEGAGSDAVQEHARYLRSHGAFVTVVESSGIFRATSEVAYPVQMERTKAAEGQLVALALGIERVTEDNKLKRVVVSAGSDLGTFQADPTISALEEIKWRSLCQASGINPLLRPTWTPPSFRFAGSRSYEIPTAGGIAPAVTVIYRHKTREEYMGFTATRFVSAPAAAPGPTFELQGRRFTVVGDMMRPERVWWQEDGVLYWVSNTLGNELTLDMLLTVAVSARPARI